MPVVVWSKARSGTAKTLRREDSREDDFSFSSLPSSRLRVFAVHSNARTPEVIEEQTGSRASAQKKCAQRKKPLTEFSQRIKVCAKKGGDSAMAKKAAKKTTKKSSAKKTTKKKK
jgi:hypothetical protein